ncbi:rRNA-processing protein efg1 [Fulvia fulva]|uniref:rRNA-processing protein EFG1 n=1 Tax=Passalora fulva TaxID=5499 RepID=A0A9Q8L8K1_PASFU|nr:rRNA-processing protein efg1 [Fulvia fulva]UJO12777.1 rRNA-processing protein efg1 [Fulvia fulva]WPV25001.1 rRNA-processing protein efg1 [Fulvia fulva]
MATKRSAPDSSSNNDSRPHWKRPKHQGVFQPKNPENHGKNSFKKAHTVNDLKKTVRNITRLLEKSKDLPANIRVEKERQLQTATRDLQIAEKARKRSEMIGKYHKIRFFDRQKAERRLKKARKALKEAEGKNKEGLKRKVEECEIDVNYAHYAPLEWEYVSLFPTRRKKEGEEEEDKGVAGKEVEKQGDSAMWERVRRCMDEGTLGDLREGRLDGKGDDDEGEKVGTKLKSVKKAAKTQRKDDRSAMGKKVQVEEEQQNDDESGDESGGGFFE